MAPGERGTRGALPNWDGNRERRNEKEVAGCSVVAGLLGGQLGRDVGRNDRRLQGSVNEPGGEGNHDGNEEGGSAAHGGPRRTSTEAWRVRASGLSAPLGAKRFLHYTARDDGAIPLRGLAYSPAA